MRIEDRSDGWYAVPLDGHEEISARSLELSPTMPPRSRGRRRGPAIGPGAGRGVVDHPHRSSLVTPKIKAAHVGLSSGLATSHSGLPS
ncbi:MAG: hypothetical protein FIB04_07525 [Gammaproteobacteria bacterium]|nr:hypothetical protein [Gammaproteobacteria bacterium]